MSEVSIEIDQIRNTAAGLEQASVALAGSTAPMVDGVETFGDPRLVATITEFAFQWERERQDVRAEAAAVAAALRYAADVYESNETTLADALGGALQPPREAWLPKGRAWAV